MAFPRMITPDQEQPPDTAMRGSAEDVGAMLAGYRDHGIEHLIVHLWPRTPEAVAELARAAAIARATVSTG